MKLLKALFVLALALVVATPAFAETQNVKVSGSIDGYWFHRDNFDLRDGNDAGSVAFGGSSTGGSEADNYFMTLTQVQVAADLTNNVSTVINLINQRDWNANNFDGGASVATEEFDVALDLAYVQMREIFYAPLTLTIGRQDLLFGRGFIIGWNPQDPQGTIQANEFTQIQGFDAVRATLDFNPWTLDFVYTKTAEGTHNPEDDRDLFINYLTYKFAEYNAVADLYYVAEVNKNAVTKFDNDTHTVGARAQFDPISQITLGGELAFQFGDYLSASSVPARDRDAWALDLFGTYRFDNQWKPDVTVEYVYLSGESDLSSGSTADYGAWNDDYRGPTYGRIHEYLETYYTTSQANDQAAGQNLQFISVGGGLNPMEDLRIGAVWYHFWAAEDMHTTTSNPNSGTLAEHIGDEINTTVTYAYTEDVTFAFMADWFLPGDLYSNPTDDTASQYVSEVKVVF